MLPRASLEATIAATQRANLPYQLAAMSGGESVTDAVAAHLAAGGISTLEVKIPRRYSHSPVEMIDLSDLAVVISLIEREFWISEYGRAARGADSPRCGITNVAVHVTCELLAHGQWSLHLDERALRAVRSAWLIQNSR